MLRHDKKQHPTNGKSEMIAVSTEVKPEKKKPVRSFTASYKLQILQEVDKCENSTEVGALLRREGLYSSHISRWRNMYNQGILADTHGRRRGPMPLPTEVKEELEQLRKQNAELQKKLAKAEVIIEIQKKVSVLLSLTSD